MLWALRGERDAPKPQSLSGMGKQAGEVIESFALLFRVTCKACGWTTDAVTLEALVRKLWNEAKREGKTKKC